MRENFRLKEKKILIISTQLRGGCFQYANNIISNWKDKCEIVLPDQGREEETVTPEWTIKYYGHNQIIRLFSFLYSILRIAYGLLLGRYQALVLFGLSQWDYYYLKLWNITKLKSFAVIHDGKMHDGESSEQLQKQIVAMMEMSTHLIFLSEYVRQLVKDTFNIDKSYHIAPHGLIDYGYTQPREQPDKPVLLFLGRVSQYKGIDMLLEAMRSVPEDIYSKLVIAGRWEENLKVIDTTDKIHVINKFLTTDEILKCLDQSDVMLFPYNEATQSGVATLALNYLKPSIVTEVGAFKEQFTAQSAMFIPPHNPNVFAQAIIELCNNVSKRDAMVEVIKQEKKNFDWEKISNDLLAYIIREAYKNESANS